VKFQNVEIKWIFQKLKQIPKVESQNVEIKWIFPKIKTSFQGEISKCRNKMDFSKN
jgi:hypothetical protein